MTREDVLKELQELIGVEPVSETELANDIMCAFSDFEEEGETQVIVEDSESGNSDWIAYINSENSTIFRINVNKNEDGDFAVADVWIA